MDNPFEPLDPERMRGGNDHFDHQAVPDDAPPAPTRHFQLGKPTRRWAYRDASGNLLGYVCRFELKDGGKEFRPLFWGNFERKLGWHWKAPEAPRSLYNLPAILDRSKSVVLITEGEKAADGAAGIFPDLVVVSPMNGSKSPAKADWQPIAGRQVVIWGDHDEPGQAFGPAVAALCHEAGAASIQIVEVPTEFPEKWDLADPLPEGFAVDRLQTLIDEAKPWKAAKTTAPDIEQQEDFRLVRHPKSDQKPGVYRAVDREDGGRSWMWLCSSLEILADTRDTGNEGWGRLLRVTDRDGVTHDWSMPMAMLAGDGADYRRQLLSLGLELAPGRCARDALHNYISVWLPKDKARCVDRVGWNGQAFVLPDTTIGDTAGEHVLLQTTQATSRFAVAGSLEDWQQSVAALAIGNCRIAFAISASFAGALLYHLGEESGGFHFMGGSSIGKTTLLRGGASVWGCNLDGWRTTDNAAEGVARNATDTLLCLDEIGQASGQVVDALAYMISNGRGKERMKRDGVNRQPITWRVLFLSTGEVGLSDKIKEHGRRARAGQEVRVVEIPADAGKGFGIFENLHGFADGDSFARHLKKASEDNKGHAARLFLERLTADIDQAVNSLAQVKKEWLSRHLPDNADGQVRRVAGRFALIAAAGELATAMNVLPWEAGEAERAAAICFRDWLVGRGGTGPAELREGLRQVQLFLEQHGSSRFEDVEPADRGHRLSFNRAGFRRKTEGIWEYLILPEVWRNEVCKGFDPAMIAREMIEHGWMTPGDGKNLAKKIRIPDIGQTRVHVVKSSFLASDNEP